MNQHYRRLTLFLLLTLLAACSKTKQIHFLENESEYLLPKKIKIEGTQHALSQTRSQTLLKAGKSKSVTALQQQASSYATTTLHSTSIEHFPNSAYIWNDAKQQLNKRNSSIPLTSPESVPIKKRNKMPAKGIR